MGVNTLGIMPNDVNIEDITNVLGWKFGVKTKTEDTHTENYKIITFCYKGEDRRMSVWVDYSDFDNYDFLSKYVKEITLIDLNLWGSSVDLIHGVVEEFGGFMTEADISGEWKSVGNF